MALPAARLPAHAVASLSLFLGGCHVVPRAPTFQVEVGAGASVWWEVGDDLSTGCDDRLVVDFYEDVHPPTYHRVSIAGTGSGLGVYTEDCDGPSGSAVGCPVVENGQLELQTVCGPALLGETTVFDAEDAPGLTWYFERENNGSCYIFGDRPAYFKRPDCAVLGQTDQDNDSASYEYRP